MSLFSTLLGRDESTDGPPRARSTDERTDEYFDAIKNARRRHVLRIVHDLGDDEGIALTDLAEMVAAGENGKEVGALTSDERKTAYVSLYQVHIPKLDTYGFVNVDDRLNVIRATDETANAVRAIDGVCDAVEEAGA